MIEPDAIEPTVLVKFGAQVTADHLIKNNDGEEDDGISADTVAVVLLDRGTGGSTSIRRAPSHPNTLSKLFSTSLELRTKSHVFFIVTTR